MKKLNLTKTKFKGITNWLFITAQVSALIWVFTSYGIAIYSMLKLGQVYTLSELSAPAINVLLGTTALKVLANAFEHNNGGLFGTSIPTNITNLGGTTNGKFEEQSI